LLMKIGRTSRRERVAAIPFSEGSPQARSNWAVAQDLLHRHLDQHPSIYEDRIPYKSHNSSVVLSSMLIDMAL
jgi:hypothetical protein